jgi:intracellular septation protein
MNPRNVAIRNFLLGGLLPLLAFVLVEQFYGTMGGIIAGLLFGLGEVAWELWRHGRVQGITILSNALVLVLGLLSLWEEDGVFFKLQPAIFMLVLSLLFLFSSALGKPFLVAAARKQNPHLPEIALKRMRGMNTRLGFLFALLAALSAYSAFYWSTAAWAFLKAAGLPLLLVLYMALEFLWMRFSAR